MYPSNQHKGYDFVIGEVILSTSHKQRPPRSVFDDSSPLVLVWCEKFVRRAHTASVWALVPY